MQPAATEIERRSGESTRLSPSPDTRARFQHDRRQSAARQPSRRRDARSACADDGDIEIPTHSGMMARLVPGPQGGSSRAPMELRRSKFQ
jgi:hypothetical protein